jgi:uncharacterized RDD family membrane protein YckC
MQALLDTVRLNETPEGVDLGLRVAGPAPRALALALDWLIRLALYLVLTPLAAFSGLGAGLILLGAFLIEWLYPVIFEVLKGTTPGKRAMGLAVVHDDGTPVGLPASMIRNLLRVVDFLPIFYGVGLISTLVDPDFRRLGDLAAGTLVIHAEGRERKLAIPKASPCPPPRGLSLATQQAILAFGERSERLSPDRRVELAEILVGRLSGAEGVRGRAAVERVQGYARWLARGR